MRAIAAKNCASDGYTQFPSAGLGMDEISRSLDRVGWVDEEEIFAKRDHIEADEDGDEWSTGHFSG